MGHSLKSGHIRLHDRFRTPFREILSSLLEAAHEVISFRQLSFRGTLWGGAAVSIQLDFSTTSININHSKPVMLCMFEAQLFVTRLYIRRVHTISWFMKLIFYFFIKFSYQHIQTNLFIYTEVAKSDVRMRLTFVLMTLPFEFNHINVMFMKWN